MAIGPYWPNQVQAPYLIESKSSQKSLYLMMRPWSKSLSKSRNNIISIFHVSFGSFLRNLEPSNAKKNVLLKSFESFPHRTL